jgi:type VI secretion system secreted protein VgrG
MPLRSVRYTGGTSTREDRLLAIDTPLGEDKLVLTEFAGEEEISQPFTFFATLRSEDADIKPEDLIGAKVTIWVKRETAEPVPLSGMVRSFSFASVDVRGFREYHAEIVPWLWFLSCTTDCRIFQNLTVPKIIETIFGEFGFTDYEMGGLTGSYQPLDFCVQYRETALAFISRWMEELGIFYFFRHEANRHVMVLGDHNRAFKPVVEKDALFGDHSGSNVSQWRHSYQFRSGRYAHKDFAFKTPSQDLRTTESSLLKLQRASAFEIYDYPGGYTQKGDGQQLTRLRMEEHEAAYHTVAGASICASFFAGGKFTMAQHHLQAEEKREYVLLRVAHSASDYTYVDSNGGPPSYDNSFDGFPAASQFRPAARTPWPTVQGPQTATVVGPPGETIYTDKYGRVKLQFHWDRRGKRDEKSSCWVRVSQNWGGKGWGGVFIPHVGHEVVVSFLEGDPDMPLVSGRVYNAENQKAMGLPANKTQSSIQDHSGNFFTMESKSGAQDVRVNAVKDMNFTVKNDYNETVASGNRTIKIETGTHTETIKGDTTIVVTDGKYMHSVAKGTAEYFVEGDITETYHHDQTTNVNSNVVINSIKSRILVTAELAIQLTSGKSQITLYKDGTITIFGKNIKIIGDETVVVSGKKIDVTGGEQSTIGVGNQNSVYDKSQVTTSGAGITSTAVGEHNISGAVVKIN